MAYKKLHSKGESYRFSGLARSFNTHTKEITTETVERTDNLNYKENVQRGNYNYV